LLLVFAVEEKDDVDDEDDDVDLGGGTSWSSAATDFAEAPA
jgi:hypothetical protein